jgi:hypothetical protein
MEQGSHTRLTTVWKVAACVERSGLAVVETIARCVWKPSLTHESLVVVTSVNQEEGNWFHFALEETRLDKLKKLLKQSCYYSVIPDTRVTDDAEVLRFPNTEAIPELHPNPYLLTFSRIEHELFGPTLGTRRCGCGQGSSNRE